MAFPENLKTMKIGDLDQAQTERLYDALEALGVDEVLDSSRTLAFLEKHYENELRKGAAANKKALQLIEAIAPMYEFCITQAALSKDAKYGVFVLEETVDCTPEKGKHKRWTAFKVSKEGVKKIHSSVSHEKSRKNAQVSISHVSENGIVLQVKGGRTLLV
ncbi:MAG: hypothetical protein N3G22_03225 [Candidatus Micrarchaeota archaeon]|nr:hypothetical protein [Candidatus Micrarchaeota archaeon]